MFKGFAERLIEEVSKQSHSKAKWNIIEKPYRRYMSWIGASILSSLSTFQPKWITKAEYDEHGVNIKLQYLRYGTVSPLVYI